MLTKRSELLTVEEVAAELRLHAATVRHYLATGQLEGLRARGKRSHWRIPREALDAYMRQPAGRASA